MIQKHKVTSGIKQAKHNVNMIGQIRKRINPTFMQPARDFFPESSRILGKYRDVHGFLFPCHRNYIVVTTSLNLFNFALVNNILFKILY